MEGKVGQALLFAGSDEFLLSDDLSTRCLGDLRRCHHGLMLSVWLYFTALSDRAPVLDTGYRGLRVLYVNNQLTVTATADLRTWTVRRLLESLVLSSKNLYSAQMVERNQKSELMLLRLATQVVYVYLSNSLNTNFDQNLLFKCASQHEVRKKITKRSSFRFQSRSKSSISVSICYFMLKTQGF